MDLSPVRDILQADGGDIELVSHEGGTAHLRLIVTGARCAECVLSKPMLETVALKLLQPATPGLTAVVIDDPRDDPRER
jgi:Fe-S cluster biogenesis protein NfuA